MFTFLKNQFAQIPQYNATLFLCSIFLSAFTLISFSFPVSFDLESLDKLIISEATVHGVDIDLRVKFFYRMLFFGMGLIVFYFLLLKTILSKIGILKSQINFLFILSTLGTCSVITSILGTNSHSFSSLSITLFIFITGIQTIDHQFNIKGKLFSHPTFLGLISSQSFILYFAIAFFLGHEKFVQNNFISIFSFSFLFFFLSYQFLNRYKKIPLRRINLLLLPLPLIPLVGFLTIESVIYLKLNKGIYIDHKLFFGGLFFLSSSLFYAWIYFKKTNYSTNQSFKYIWGPSVILCFVFLSSYFPIIAQKKELYELANPANSVMNVFQFKQIPLIDFMSSHMLAEQWYGYLYALVFGYTGKLDFLVYEFMNIIPFVFLLYYFLNQLFLNPILSVFFILCFPFLGFVFFPNIFLALIMFFIIEKAINTTNPKTYFSVFAGITLLIVWRLDTGITALMSSLFFIPIMGFVSVKKIYLKDILKGFLLFLISILVLLGIAIIIRSPEYIWDNFQCALHYVTANQAHGYKSLSNNFPQQFYIYHVLFPAIAGISILYIIYSLWKNKTGKIFSQQQILFLKSSLFLFFIFISNAQRGLVRHGFAEGSEVYILSVFFVALSLLIIFLSKNKKLHKQFPIFYLSLFIFFVSFKFFHYKISETTLEKSVSKNTFLQLSPTFNKNLFDSRVIMDNNFSNYHYKDLKSFMDKNLSEEQTFLDFSNTPMLYFYCNKNIPGYFNQNLQNTVDDFLQLELIKNISPEEVPLVIFSNYPPNWFDATDNIPNVMRYYLVAEYIFKHYEPFGIINHRSIWIAKSSKHKFDDSKFLEKDTLISKPQYYNYQLSAGHIADFHIKNPFEFTENILTKSFNSSLIGKDTVTLKLNNSVPELHHCWLSVEFDKALPNKVEVLLNNSEDENMGRFSFDSKNSKSDIYMLRLSNHYLWHSGETKSLQIIKPKDIGIKEVSILKDTRIEN